jgi:hypothetical protein
MLVKKRAKGPQATRVVNPDELAMPSGIFLLILCIFSHIYVYFLYYLYEYFHTIQ